jgi:hypothetical protein
MMALASPEIPAPAIATDFSPMSFHARAAPSFYVALQQRNNSYHASYLRSGDKLSVVNLAKTTAETPNNHSNGLTRPLQVRRG